MSSEIFELAKFMHEQYEAAAGYYGWKNQKKCRVGWTKLPQKNIDTMLFVAEKVIGFFEKKSFDKVFEVKQKEFDRFYEGIKEDGLHGSYLSKENFVLEFKKMGLRVEGFVTYDTVK